MFLSESWHEPDVKRKLKASFKKKKKAEDFPWLQQHKSWEINFAFETCVC